MTTQEIIDNYAEQGTDIVNDHDFRAEAIEMSEFSLSMLQSGSMDDAVEDTDEAIEAMEELLDILRSFN